MLESSLRILKRIESRGFKAYIVGGFVRDYILGNKSSDVDISTNATPKQIKEIFPSSFLPNESYGSITVIYNKVRFEITTFRKEFDYVNNRKPSKVEYISSLEDDLKRRDFTINTLCINSNGEIIDLLGNKKDINDGIIRTVSNSFNSFMEDSLRILRAVRFATVLNFRLSDEVKYAIKNTKRNLLKISYERKKSELDKIFMSSNVKYGIRLLKDLNLDDELEINGLDNIKISSDLLGIWASIDVSEKYPFTKPEKELIGKIKTVSKLNNLDSKVLYEYGPYVNSVAGVNKGISKIKIVRKYNSLPIKSRNEINITSAEIVEIIKKPPSRYITEIYLDLENGILNGLIKNEKEDIKNYIKRKWTGGNCE